MTSTNKIPNSPVGSPDNISDGSSKEHDRFLPIANVSRIMKKSLPANAKISKEAKETVQECVSEFISFITGEASDKCQREKRKTINGDDLLWSMTTLGFENYVGPLKVHLNKYSETDGSDKCIVGKEDGVLDLPSFGHGEKEKSFDSQSKNLGFYATNVNGEQERVMGFSLGKLRDIDDTSTSHLHQGVDW